MPKTEKATDNNVWRGGKRNNPSLLGGVQIGAAALSVSTKNPWNNNKICPKTQLYHVLACM